MWLPVCACGGWGSTILFPGIANHPPSRWTFLWNLGSLSRPGITAGTPETPVCPHMLRFKHALLRSDPYLGSAGGTSVPQILRLSLQPYPACPPRSDRASIAHPCGHLTSLGSGFLSQEVLKFAHPTPPPLLHLKVSIFISNAHSPQTGIDNCIRKPLAGHCLLTARLPFLLSSDHMESLVK